MKRLLSAFAAILMTLPLAAQTTSLVQDNVGNNEAMYYFHQRKVARSSTGTLMVVWVDKRSGIAGGQVQYSIYDPGFEVWSPPAALSSAAYNARQPALAADASGNIHAVWMESTSAGAKYQVFYSKYNGSSWSSAVQVSVAASVRGEEPTIEVGTDGTVWVAYNNDGEGIGNEYVYVVKSTDGGSNWSATADTISSGGNISSSITNARVALARASAGKIVAVWHDGQPWNVDRREIYFNSFNGSSWGTAEMISDTTTSDRSANWYPTVAVDGSDNIYVIYHTNNVDVDRLLLCQKKAWADAWTSSTTSVIAVETNGDMLSVSATADENDVVHLAYRRDVAADTLYGLDEIVYTFTADGGSTWSTPIVVSRVDQDAGYVSMANTVDPTYGMDLAWRESRDANVSDQDTLAVVHANIPYSVTSVSEELPESFEVFANYPNPFNPSTTIEFTLATRSQVRLTIFDLTGREVKTVVNENRDAGAYRETWDGTNNLSQPVSSGVYFSRLSTGNGLRTIKMILLK